MSVDHFDIQGLNAAQVREAREKYGSNRLTYKKESGLLHAIKSIIKEPMVILLLVTSSIYFITGNTEDGIFLACAIVLVAGISLYQDSRSRNALEKLKAYSQPGSKVVREGQVMEVPSDEIVMGDSLMVEEGMTIVADAQIVHSNDFSVDESILTGESLSVYKDAAPPDNAIYRGTIVASGLAIATVTAVGNATKLGQIGESLEGISEEKTPLELQIGNFVKYMVIIGAVVFLIVWGINFFRSHDALDSLLKALTLAMSILPEEIPVAFTTFMALGAWRLMKMGIVVKQMKTVETLGSATVICTDKTGTLTENQMSLARVYVHATQNLSEPAQAGEEEKSLIRWAMWASEPIPFDPMEKALHKAYKDTRADDERPRYKMAHEYPLGGKPPMMTHIFEDKEGHRVIAAKGAPEAIMSCSALTEEEINIINGVVNALASEGYRILAVGQSDFKGKDFPAAQQEFEFKFEGLVAFYDPPKHNIPQTIEAFYTAGMDVKIVTGDNATTTTSIARQIGFKGYDKSLTGDELMQLKEEDLEAQVEDTFMFSRMFPEAKLRIINALKARKQIVAMTGDGVNDGPALKAAHIGIAMGKKGTEIAKQAASLILLEDDLSKMVDAVAMGRKIYANLKKAIQYIISIHIPIILTVFIPLAMGWIYPFIFSPVHIIFLELIMGPTCSIMYENEPMEKNTMQQSPRPFTTTFFSWRELTTSILQGLVITVGVLAVYQYGEHTGLGEHLTRTMVFLTLVSANIFLTLVNRSFYYSVFTSLKNKNNLVPIITLITTALTLLVLYVPPLTRFFDFETPEVNHILISVGTGFVFVVWYEFVKVWKRRKARRKN